MSKIKPKSADTGAEEKRIRNIIIVAVILVAPSVATTGCDAEQSAGRE